MTPFETVTYTKTSSYGLVKLNRPEVLNAFNTIMRDEFAELLQAVRDDPEVKALIIAGSPGGSFCSGADLTEFGTAPSQIIARQVRWERDVWGMLRDLPKVTVAAIGGYCLGSGLELASLCDIRVASADAIFGMPEVRLGLIPGAGGTQMLSRLLGKGASLDLLLTGRTIGAQDALSLGMIHALVGTSVLHDEGLRLAKKVVEAIPGKVVTSIKRAVNEGMDMSLRDGLELESRLNALLGA